MFFERHRFILAFVVLSAITGSGVGIAKVTTSLYAVHLGAHETLLGTDRPLDGQPVMERGREGAQRTSTHSARSVAKHASLLVDRS